MQRSHKCRGLCRLGTSPEFELALYTLCFVAGGEKSVIELSNSTGVYEVEIRYEHWLTEARLTIVRASTACSAASQKPCGCYSVMPSRFC